MQECIGQLGTGSGSPRADAGTSDLVLGVEREIAKFVGEPDAMVFSMGFSTDPIETGPCVAQGQNEFIC